MRNILQSQCQYNYGHHLHLQVCGGHISGMFGFFFCEGPVTCFADATKSDTEKFAKWHRMMLQKAGAGFKR